MSLVSIREKILQDLKTALQNITIANGYTLDISLVSRELKHWEETQRFPSLFVIDGDERIEWSTTENLNSAPFGIKVIGYVKKAKSQDGDLSQELNKLIRDFKVAALADLTRGGNCEIFEITLITTDKGTIYPFAAFEADIECKFEWRRNEP